MAELKAGDVAPEFALPDHEGDIVSLRNLRGRRLLIYFYPMAGTPYCTRQACSIRDAGDALRDAGVVALGISPDSPEKLKAFREKRNLNFPLLSDPDHAVAEAYGAYGRKRLLFIPYRGTIRSAFVVDEEGKIAACTYNVKPRDTVQMAFAALAQSRWES
jgi:peroxiredoxin Q/BCP